MAGNAAAFPGTQFNLRQPNGLFKLMAEIEAEAMQAALDHYEGNITRAVEALSIAKSTLLQQDKNPAPLAIN